MKLLSLYQGMIPYQQFILNDYMKKHSKIYPLYQEPNRCFERTFTLLNFMDR